MNEHTAESKSWSSPESHLTIEYPLELLDEIRLSVASGFHAKVEVGGVFFGTRTEEAVRIAAWRPISREQDVGLLVESAGLEAVGWFVTHARGSLEPTEGDLQIFNQFFPRDWQFTLVLLPELVGPTKAAFFVRNADGKLCDHKPDLEFVIEPLRAARVHGRRSPPPEEPVEPPPELATDRPEAVEQRANLVRVRPGRPMSRRLEPPPRPPIVDGPPAPRPKKKWLRWVWVVPVAGLLVYAAIVARERLFTDSRPATLSLKLQDWPGAQLHVDWEKEAQPIQIARRGEIVFEDAGKTRTMELDASLLRLGTFAYARRSGNVKVKLSVYGENGAAPSIEEVAEFNGPPPDDATPAPKPTAPTPNDERVVWEKQRADLEAQIKRLRGQLATETAKRQEFQNLVRVLENRLKLGR